MFVDYLAERAELRAYAAAPKKPAEVKRQQEKTAAAAAVSTAPSREAPSPERAPAATEVTLAAKAAAAEGSLPAPAAPETPPAGTPGTLADTGLLADKAVTPASGPDGEADIEPILALAEGDADDETMTGAIPSPRPDDESAETSSPEEGEEPTTAEKSTGRTAKVLKYVNLRSRPADESKVLTVVPARAKVNVLSCKSWCEVEYSGTKGFNYKRFIGSS
jgi:hypothetical protein